MAKAKAKRSGPQKLWLLWREYSRTLAKRGKKISEAVCAQISADAARFSRIGDSDEAVYSHLVGLMGAYRRVIEFADKHSPESETVRVMIAGICEVLGARLREFEENASGEENPIAAEKQAIIADATKNLTIAAHQTPDELWAIYRDTLQICQARIDDLHGRKIARFYTELVEREWEELGNIINVQVRALKDTGARDAVIFSIADALGEAYQLTGPVVKNLKKPAPQKNDGRTREEFERELALDKNAGAEGKKFFAALDAQTIAALDEIETGYKRAAYKLQRSAIEEILLANEITRVFEKIALPEIEQEILAGIRETIEIKIAGLKESTADFEIKSTQGVKNFLAEKPAPEREEILRGVRGEWLENPPKENAQAAFFETALADCREGAGKYIETHAQALEKSALRFKKEVVLYEICTFEEILTHSVPRLRESRDGGILSAVLALEDTFRALAVILKKNNIEIIRPEVKSQFNAREHEVLVAEKSADFQKGEIIKVIAAGYRFKEHVILRATVIAAR